MLTELSLFTGMGGGIYGSLILGWKTIAYVEKDAYCQKVIKQRQEDGAFEKGHVYGDIINFNQYHAIKYQNKIDVITGGFPCQPFSVAGKRKGTSDERYIFDEIIKTITIIQPRWLFFENVPGILSSNAIIEIYQALDKIGYQCNPALVLGSAHCGNIHKRERVWIFAAHTSSVGRFIRKNHRQKRHIHQTKIWQSQKNKSKRSQFFPRSSSHTPVYNSNNWCQRVQRGKSKTLQGKSSLQRRKSIRSIENLLSRPDIPQPLFCGMDDELPHWKQQIKAIGNGQDPIVMATAWQLSLKHSNKN